MTDMHESVCALDEEAVDWRPLEDLIGPELADEFMWMYRVALEDGGTVHVYKHIATRRWMHVGTDGRCFAFVPESSYRDVPARWAIATAFRDWEDAEPQPERPDHVRAELARLTRRSRHEPPRPGLRLIRGEAV